MDSLLINALWNNISPSLLYTVIANITLHQATKNFELDKKFNPNPALGFEAEYDYIVVLLLEAGGDPLGINDIPFLWLDNVGHPDSDWMLETVPQKNCALAYPNNIIAQPRGKSLGGTSNLNAMAFWRGNPNDFNTWANLTQDEEWSHEKLLPYFKNLENYDGSFAKSPKYHGELGPIHVTRQTFHPLKTEWITAGIEMGFPYEDPDAIQTSIDVSGLDGKRWEVYHGFLEKALQKKNLDVLRYAEVTKINLSGDAGRAESVTYTRFGQVFTAKAKREIVISAGTYNSPKLLLLSGIGPSEHLRSVGIEPKINLPGVGSNYIDHVVSTIGPFLLNDSVSFIQKRDLTAQSVIDYVTNGTGPLSWNLLQGNGLISTHDEPDWPDIIYHHMPIGGNNCKVLGPLSEGICDKYMQNVGENQDAMWAIMFLGRDPKSRGTVKLRSNNPFDAPLIDPNLFSEREDVKAMVDGTMYHPSSTCKMGASSDPMAVVDSNLKVRGVSNLRIADASVMPIIVNVNINAATMLIGEKAFYLITKDWEMDSSAMRRYIMYSWAVLSFAMISTLVLFLVDYKRKFLFNKFKQYFAKYYERSDPSKSDVVDALKV
ncbi:Oxygen-dependent choline dehydrogenase [Folsomia candida]|uniref:Oxygen-dependent choline dehydrogenase n=1 Tax=Folsomia candida TaxID=158441 RepID=A0A226DZQ5_FOLCA|nr:Oxygen-dependent choline dehydrogenase [Folsomia candida]